MKSFLTGLVIAAVATAYWWFVIKNLFFYEN